MDRLTGLEVFAQVAASGSFSETARRLGLSKSAVSKHVAALEKRLGTRLLHRTTRRLSLTQQGAAYYERCRQILTDLAEADGAVSQMQAQSQGLLKISAPLSFGILHLAPALPHFLAQHPKLEAELIYNDRLVDLVHEGFDVAVRISQPKDSSLIARPIAAIRHVLCASPAYLARCGTPRDLQALSTHNCLCYSYQPYTGEWRFTDAAGQVHKIPVGGNLRANNGETLLAAALRGTGIVLLPDFIVGPALAEGELVGLLEDYAAHELTLQAVYPYTRHVSAKVRTFVDFLVARFSAADWARRLEADFR